MPVCATCQAEHPIEDFKAEQVRYVPGWLRLRCQACVRFFAGMAEDAAQFAFNAKNRARREHVKTCPRCTTMTSTPPPVGGTVDSCPDLQVLESAP